MKRALWTAVALLGALLIQSGLSLIWPDQSGVIDLFLLVVVYFALTRGELWGLWVGSVAGWIQDIHFGGAVLGLAALTRLLVGFGVGAAAARLLLAGFGARLLVVFLATLVDGRLLEWLASLFEIPVEPLPASQLLTRAVVNALVGATIFEGLERRGRPSLKR